MSEELIEAITQLKEKEAVELVKKALDAGTPPLDLLVRCQAGMDRVGELFEQKKYYLSELVYSASIMQQISEMLEQAIRSRDESERPKSKGGIILGTIAGDLHEIGKNIVSMLLGCAGYQVVDLGMEVMPEQFVEKVKETDIHVVGISALMTTSFQGMKRVVELLDEQGLRPSVKVMIGGGIVDERARRFTGADAHSKNGYDAVVFCKRFYS